MFSWKYSVQVIVISVSLGAILITMLLISSLRSKVLSDQDDVVVTASVPSCIIEITARPEDRIPVVNNWSTLLNVDVRTLTESTVANFSGNSNNQGTLTYNLCANSQNVPSGTYNFYIRGFSHLRKKFPNVTSFTNYSSSVSFIALSQYLTAGETSIVFDNFINGLDLSTQVIALGTGDIKNDLNRDGLVNALDLSITVKNLYELGD